MNENAIVAVVVTFNRHELLKECIEAIRRQTRLLDAIIVINNGSTDGTAEWLATLSDVTTVTQANTGGAGGFNTGIRVAAEREPDWIWCMDDDTIPDPTALEALLSARANLAQMSVQPAILCSAVRWTDGGPHLMNGGLPKKNIIGNQAMPDDLIPMRACTFVSILLRGDMPKHYGLPITDFFIWADDFEYTARILRFEHGYMVKESKALHKTRENYNSLNDSGGRHYYSIRNNIWIILYSYALTPIEKMFTFRWLILVATCKYLMIHKGSAGSIKAVLKGFIDGLFSQPDFSDSKPSKLARLGHD